ncbi:MAG: transcription antitermination factor NusB [Eubacteriales bacterium]|nr:transcription antitermination factor NusB [Eubacteriales bacterium]
MTRHEIRNEVFLVLFSLDFHEGENMRDLIIRYLDETAEEKAEDFERAEIIKKVLEIKDMESELDKKIAEKATGWKLERIGKAELNILRLAIYEIEKDDEVPVKVAINEAVNLAKEYCNDDAPSFINGILGKIAG